ncbi:hypothetical protein F511_46026 [Dorcoceras hygrometricum]|uniref:Uncharacterized protein n=1 Tax=Dorcoceras hygrometricum TaxID=472368 RepID=A0A2Z7A227_9LAMI|nr:hypothetical protein F511_46026 [Dorcoceras hygrometricum]
MVRKEEIEHALIEEYGRTTRYRSGHNSHTLYLALAAPLSTSTSRPPCAAAHLPQPASVRFLRGWTCSDHVNEEFPFVTNSSALIVQTNEGGMIPIMDRIRRSTAAYL